MSAALRRALGIAAVIAVALLAWWAGQARTVRPDDSALNRLHQLELRDLEGRLQGLDQWRGQVVVINFWATWCPPCRRELPDFARLSRAYAERGVHFVGIGIDDVVKLRAFRDQLNLPYTMLVGDVATLQLSAGLGNPSQGLPFTLLLDREGGLAFAHVGGLKADTLERKIRAQLSGQ